jgi:hypothetical protein
MHTAEIKVTFGGHVGNVRGNSALLAQFPDLGRGFGVVNCAEDHICAVEVGGFKGAVDVGDLVFGDAVGYFGV